MRLIIDIPEEVVTAIRNGEDYRYDIHTAIAQGMPFFNNITDEQLSAAFQIAIVNYWEKKSKYLTPPPTPCDCPNFISSPIEVVKVGEPLSNSDEISKALEKGDIYKRGFEYGYLKGKEERPKGEWIKTPELFRDRICSHCGKQISYEKIGKFCIECGADMRKEEDNE